MYDEYVSDNDYDEINEWDWQFADYAGDCDRCGDEVPNGHGHYINDDTERVCGDCYEEAAK